MRKFLLCLVAMSLLPAAASNAAVMSPATAGGYAVFGSGIPANNFTTNSAATGKSAWLKARMRDTGQAINVIGNRYFVDPGLALDGINPAWSFDWMAVPDTIPAANYLITLLVDFDPGVGVENFVTLSLPLFDADASPFNSWDDGDSYLTNPGGGAWTTTDPYVVGNSWHLGFAFWPLLGASPLYNPFIDGEYKIELYEGFPGTAPVGTEIYAVVGNPTAAVPEPGTLAMFAFGAIGLVASGFRRLKK